jgi:8-oxo-dGTP diphosphatase
VKTYYVLGFYFSIDCQEVALILKNKPDWQAGKLNGIGGKIELNETPLEAMQREFREETGLYHAPWKKFAELTGEHFIVHCFTGKGEPQRCRTKESEPVNAYGSLLYPGQLAKMIGSEIYVPVIGNLTWLIPLAIDTYRDRDLDFVSVEYQIRASIEEGMR